ncbi:2-phosphosulfolactate phosphatase [Actinomycetospora cinnamomea]|uniref:Probable 2-phosphosulfolactate phosphatase n=1 Tax=Actinomycetospora cinnamomea TaxID=663609 RepID=A0A2U1FRS8_9PSEU|nr:2-phosphosulfolactate phosphatase [Actinomycetospora cinnamomea]
MSSAWGATGVSRVATGGDLAVVVDVLSFTTTLSVAADRGTRVVPCPWLDERANALAREHDAELAVRRGEAGPGRVSLSPVTVRAAGPLPRLVLPSPNGSTISAQLADRDTEVVGGCLRNRRAVAQWLHHRGADGPPRRVVVVPAGEVRPDGSRRRASEDLWGAGAVIRALSEIGPVEPSPDARAAAAAFDAVAHDLPRALHRCTSGVELREHGFADDVDVAAELDRSTAVPTLLDGVFEPAG